MPLVWLRTLCLMALLPWIQVIVAPTAMAATNAVTAGIGGINNGTLAGGDGTGTGQITINSVQLALVKQARDVSGTVLPGGSNVSVGQTLYFVLYVDNTTDAVAENIQLTDLLDESEFTYIPNSLETTLVGTASSDAAIWGGTWSALTDIVGGPDDTASVTDTSGPVGLDRMTIGAVPGQVNQNLDIPAGELRAIRFRVTVN